MKFEIVIEGKAVETIEGENDEAACVEAARRRTGPWERIVVRPVGPQPEPAKPDAVLTAPFAQPLTPSQPPQSPRK
ncbi:MAG TPA: hypothetical protein VNJ04_05195 [Gemmatimonadaceae bacterium]|nr:hypothetical protein [Gemmatimonadaceae bacterium]